MIISLLLTITISFIILVSIIVAFGWVYGLKIRRLTDYILRP